VQREAGHDQQVVLRTGRVHHGRSHRGEVRPNSDELAKEDGAEGAERKGREQERNKRERRERRFVKKTGVVKV